MESKVKVSLSEALGALKKSPHPYVKLIENGSMKGEIFAPKKMDTQTPHTQDEIYIVLRGTGEFIYEEEQFPVSEGDFIFVPATKVHRFVNFTDDLLVWVIFYGPER